MNDPILILEGTVSWNVVLSSPNAVAYRFWSRQPGQDWEILVDGKLSDEIVDEGSFEAVKGTEFAYWFGIGSDKPIGPYSLATVLTQGGKVLVNGVLPEIGNVDETGLAMKQKTVTFRVS